MNILEQKIIEKIKKEGPITFETFMDMALYYPELGYYTSPETVTGRKGDFYTSPHLHSIFGAMIGKQLKEMWEIMGRPPHFYAVEIGAGTGHLCSDILTYLKNREVFNSLNYVIIELNPAMTEKQKNLVTDFREKVNWLSSVTELENIKGCIFSNELLDAFPVHIIHREEGTGEKAKSIKEIYIELDGNDIIEIKRGVNTHKIIDYFKQFQISIPPGYRTEINLRIKDWLEEIDSALSEGFILTIDYGYTAQEYYSTDRTRGTLLCYHKHRVTENPYENIGKQDITAHVNFSSLKKWGEGLGLKTIGYCPQGTFLVALGIDEVITELYGNSPDYSSEVLKIKGLILPQGMGESYKVMIQYKGNDMPKLRGFSMRNQIGTL